MKLHTMFGAAILAAAGLFAQEEAPVAAGGGLSEAAVSAQLVASTEVLTVGGSFSLTLTVDFKQDVEVDATLLGGHYLQTYLDGQRSVTLDASVPGKVKVAAGARLMRTVDVDAASLWTAEELEQHQVLSLDWSGVPGASTTLRLVPDQTDLDVTRLDLARTRVKLVTSKGVMVVGFRPDKALKTVANFIKLSKDGFYHGTRFHRIIAGFMVQGGDPNTRRGATGAPGTGGPGYTIDAEFNDLRHVRGVLSMARSRDPNSAGSQFFIMHGKAQQLDGSYTAFGQIESGLEVLDAIANTQVRLNPRGEASVPVEDVWVYAAVVEPVFKEE